MERVKKYVSTLINFTESATKEYKTESSSIRISFCLHNTLSAM